MPKQGISHNLKYETEIWRMMRKNYFGRGLLFILVLWLSVWCE